MENDHFITGTDEKYMRKLTNRSSVIAFGILSLFGCIGFLVSWQLFVFIEGVLLISSVVAFIQNRKKSQSWRLEFHGDELTITNLQTKEEFWVRNIPASDFVINQSKNEMKMDYCSLMIRKTVFVMGGVKNCTRLKEYILDHYR